MSTTEAVIILGGGQAALATAYYLRRGGIDPLILDDEPGPGGSWRRFWPGMRLFSGPSFSNLPGMRMPAWEHEGQPTPAHVVDYFTRYEQRYDLRARRPVHITEVTHTPDGFTLADAHGTTFRAATLVAATGTFSRPYTPHYPGHLKGLTWHTADYPGTDVFRGRKVAVVGGGNSGAQIAAELSAVADVTWLTRRPPRFMPEEITGARLFQLSHERYLAILRGEPDPGPMSQYGDIIQVPLVREARRAGKLAAEPMVASLDELDARGFEHLIWATGFTPALAAIHKLVDTEAMRPLVAGLHLVGYDDRTFPGSATIVGVGANAKAVAGAILAGS